MSLPKPAQADQERGRDIKFTVTIGGAYGTLDAARATVDKVKHDLEIMLQRPIKITGRRYG